MLSGHGTYDLGHIPRVVLWRSCSTLFSLRERDEKRRTGDCKSETTDDQETKSGLLFLIFLAALEESTGNHKAYRQYESSYHTPKEIIDSAIVFSEVERVVHFLSTIELRHDRERSSRSLSVVDRRSSRTE